MQESTSSSLLRKSADLAYRAVAVDIDGTLLNEAKDIPLANKDVLAHYRAAGGTVILISGRLPISVFWHAELLEIDAPFVAMNGAYIGRGREMLLGQTFSADSVLQFLALCRQKQLYCHIYTNTDMFYDNPSCWNNNWTERNYAWLEGQPRSPEKYLTDKAACLGQQVSDLADFVKNQNPAIYKLAVFAERSLQDEWSDFEALPGVTVTSSDVSFNLELTPAGVSKGSSLLCLADLLGIDPASILAIGDNHNDISMLQVAGLGVAMGNAPEAVRRYASQVTTTNNDSGVANAVRRWAYAR